MTTGRRVVVTGIGVLSPIGNDLASYWDSLANGRVGIAPPTRVDPDILAGEMVAEVKDFDPSAHFTDRELAPLDRVSQIAVVAARQAVDQAGIDFSGDLGERTAAIIGTGIGGSDTIDDSYHRLYGTGAKRVYPLTVPKLMPNAPASQVSMHLGVRGPSFGIVSACSSATHAIGTAFHMIRAGLTDAAITGGAESCINLGTLKGWEAMRVMANDTCRPFSKGRRGLVLGEGASLFVLETMAAAEARGAEVLGEVIGFGMSADAADLTNPDVGGMARAMRACLDDAGLEPGDVDYINAHGTGTAANDKAETAALKSAFGDAIGSIPASSTKSMVGHALGAAGALEFAAAVLAVRNNVAPPTANYLGPDPACDLDYVTEGPRPMPIDVAVSNSFAFGGLNAVLAARAA